VGHSSPCLTSKGLYQIEEKAVASGLPPIVANGNDIRLVQELLRHSNPLITLDAYVRSTTPAKIEAQGWVMQQLLNADVKLPVM